MASVPTTSKSSTFETAIAVVVRTQMTEFCTTSIDAPSSAATGLSFAQDFLSPSYCRTNQKQKKLSHFFSSSLTTSRTYLIGTQMTAPRALRTLVSFPRD
ncbi:hypothetical protein AVEN_159769-1 [Araneus ventricosus]|uniref:Uncharacterized protein n=1 Tax=Araneus ventricosus TaxID=182803 RepID=A0A4Y2D9H3_ARAVE|nr:hypothetical protein AVEN_159769-1 [Araneus ventricosus]